MKTAQTTPKNTQDNAADIIKALQKRLQEKDAVIEQLQHQIYLFRNAKFGRKSEKQSSDQLELVLDESYEKDSDQDIYSTDTDDKDFETITYKRSKKRASKSLPKTLPYVGKIHDLADGEKVCGCGCALTHIKDDITEQLDVLPQTTFPVVHIQKKYACKTCDSTIKQAKKEAQIIPRSIAIPGLLAAIIDAKFHRHLPLYRQTQIFKDMGTPLSRAVMCDWLIKISEHLTPLIKLLHDEILNYDIAYADETPLKMLKQKNKKNSINS